MSLKYDFDLFSVVPAEIYADAALGDLMQSAGTEENSAANKVALFRDPDTAKALASSSEEFKAYMLESGFGLNTYDSGAGDNFYPAEDDELRTQIAERLNTNFAKFDLKDHLDGPFDLIAFLDHLDETRPLETAQESPVAPTDAPDETYADPIPSVDEAIDFSSDISADLTSELPQAPLASASEAATQATSEATDGVVSAMLNDASQAAETGASLDMDDEISETENASIAAAIAETMVVEETSEDGADDALAAEAKTPFWKKPFAMFSKDKTDDIDAPDLPDVTTEVEKPEVAIAAAMEEDAKREPFWKSLFNRKPKDAVETMQEAASESLADVEEAASAKQPFWKKPIALRAGAVGIVALTAGWVFLP